MVLMRTFLFTFIGLALFGCVNAAQLEQLRVSTDAQKTRLVFDLSDTTTFKSFTLKNPDRLVVDFKKSRVAKSFVPSASVSSLLRNVRFAERNDGSVRVVLDLTGAVSEKSFSLAPKGSEGHRVVMDLSSDAIVAEAPKKVAVSLKSNTRRVFCASVLTRSCSNCAALTHPNSAKPMIVNKKVRISINGTASTPLQILKN